MAAGDAALAACARFDEGQLRCLHEAGRRHGLAQMAGRASPRWRCWLPSARACRRSPSSALGRRRTTTGACWSCTWRTAAEYAAAQIARVGLARAGRASARGLGGLAQVAGGAQPPG